MLSVVLCYLGALLVPLAAAGDFMALATVTTCAEKGCSGELLNAIFDDRKGTFGHCWHQPGTSFMYLANLDSTREKCPKAVVTAYASDDCTPAPDDHKLDEDNWNVMNGCADFQEGWTYGSFRLGCE